MKRKFRGDTKGQVIVITALLIALIILATQVYVTQLILQAPIVEQNQYDLYPSYQQNLKSAILSALANITNNGVTQVLAEDMAKLNPVYSSRIYQQFFQVDFTLSSNAPYQNGLWIDNGQLNHAIVAAQVSYGINSTESTKTSIAQGSVSIISEAYLSGRISQINENEKQANLTLRIINEGIPALASNISCFYQGETGWVQAEPLSIFDFGNGTSTIGFIAQSSQSSSQLNVSTNVLDQRGITMRVNATCAS
jgi:hypothetical protein